MSFDAIESILTFKIHSKLIYIYIPIVQEKYYYSYIKILFFPHSRTILCSNYINPTKNNRKGNYEVTLLINTLRCNFRNIKIYDIVVTQAIVSSIINSIRTCNGNFSLPCCLISGQQSRVSFNLSYTLFLIVFLLPKRRATQGNNSDYM
jgi:hypothetical protein